MNGLSAALDEARAVAAQLDRQPAAARVAIFPPATLLHRLSEAVEGSFVLVGGQDCHGKASGAHTGDISGAMLVNLFNEPDAHCVIYAFYLRDIANVFVADNFYPSADHLLGWQGQRMLRDYQIRRRRLISIL